MSDHDKNWNSITTPSAEPGADAVDGLVTIRITKQANAALIAQAQKYGMEVSEFVDRIVFSRVSIELKALRGVEITKEMMAKIERGTSSLH